MLPVLLYRNLHARVGLDELFSLMLAFEHIDLDVLELQLADQAVELEGAAIRIERKANDIDFILLDASNMPWSSVNLLFAQICSHDDVVPDVDFNHTR